MKIKEWEKYKREKLNQSSYNYELNNKVRAKLQEVYTYFLFQQEAKFEELAEVTEAISIIENEIENLINKS